MGHVIIEALTLKEALDLCKRREAELVAQDKTDRAGLAAATVRLLEACYLRQMAGAEKASADG